MKIDITAHFIVKNCYFQWKTICQTKRGADANKEQIVFFLVRLTRDNSFLSSHPTFFPPSIENVI